MVRCDQRLGGLDASITLSEYHSVSTRIRINTVRDCVRTVSDTPSNPAEQRQLRGRADVY